jgi:ribose-phosphate pyrophosphokinase
MNIIGDINGKNVILVDDMIDTAGTITNAANALKQRGASEVYACCTHPVLSGAAIERIEKSEISELVVLNTVKLTAEKMIPKIKQLSVAKAFGDAIYRIHEGLPVSKIFD